MLVFNRYLNRFYAFPGGENSYERSMRKLRRKLRFNVCILGARFTWFTDLTFAQLPAPMSIAKKLNRFFINMQRAQEKKLTYAWRLECGGINKRIHVHILWTTEATKEQIEEEWGLGYVDHVPVEDDEGALSYITKYFSKTDVEQLKCKLERLNEEKQALPRWKTRRMKRLSALIVKCAEEIMHPTETPDPKFWGQRRWGTSRDIKNAPRKSGFKIIQEGDEPDQISIVSVRYDLEEKIVCGMPLLNYVSISASVNWVLWRTIRTTFTFYGTLSQSQYAMEQNVKNAREKMNALMVWHMPSSSDINEWLNSPYEKRADYWQERYWFPEGVDKDIWWKQEQQKKTYQSTLKKLVQTKDEESTMAVKPVQTEVVVPVIGREEFERTGSDFTFL